MPAVITFWQLPDEEKEFLDFLESTGHVVAIPVHWVKDRADLSPQPIRNFIEKHDPDRLYFGLESQLADVDIQPSEYEGEWGYKGPSGADACLIGYDRPKFRSGTKLVQSNLAAYWTCLDETQSTMVDKTEDFVRWGKKVFGWVRKHTPEWHGNKGYRATKRVKDSIEEGSIEVVSY
jgi:hypothetical protein